MCQKFSKNVLADAFNERQVNSSKLQLDSDFRVWKITESSITAFVQMKFGQRNAALPRFRRTLRDDSLGRGPVAGDALPNRKTMASKISETFKLGTKSIS
jgi:hypothetical protein